MSAPDNVLVEPLELSGQALVEDTLDLAAVYRRHAHDVMRWATRLSGRPDDASDITQEVFCVVQRKLDSWRPGQGSLQTWLFRITEHVTRARRRKDRLYRFLFGERELPLEIASADPAADQRLQERRDAAA